MKRLLLAAIAAVILAVTGTARAQQYSPAGGGAGGGVSSVSGTAPVSVATGTTTPVVSLTLGTAGQFLMTNAAASAATWVSCGGDATCATATPGSFTIGKLNGGSSGQFALAGTDFIAMGVSPAASGWIRIPATAATIIQEGTLSLLTTTGTVGAVNLGNAGGAATLGNGSYFFSAGGTASGILGVQSAVGSLTTNGIQFSNSLVSGIALGIVPTYNGATSLVFGAGVTVANITQASAAGASAIGATTTVAAQNETGTTSTGGALALTSGTGTSSPGPLNLQVGAVTVDSAQCGTPLAGIGHAGGVNALCTVAQATSATATRYRVQYLCKATTLYTGGAATDTWATAVSYVVRNVGGTLTAVAVTTADTELITDTSVSANSATMSLSGTNVTFNVTPPTVAAGVETCSAVARVSQTL